MRNALRTLLGASFGLGLTLAASGCTSYLSAAPDDKGNLFVTYQKSFIGFQTKGA